jgi:hypothetical protein
MQPLHPEPALAPSASALARPPVAGWGRLRDLALRRESIVFAILILGSIGFDFTHPTFLSRGNLEQIFTNVAVVALVSIGMTLVIVTGGIDVSVGSAACSTERLWHTGGFIRSSSRWAPSTSSAPCTSVRSGRTG